MKALRITFLSACALFLFCCSYGVMAQTASYRAYSCPTAVLPGGATGSTGVIDTRADTHTSCPTWSWAATSPTGTAIRRDAALPLVGVCATAATCNWNANNVRWKRPSSVLVTDRIAVCAGTTAGDNCSPQSFQLRDAVLAPPLPVDPPPPPPVPTVRVLVNAVTGWTYDQFMVTWESANAVSCRGTWTPAGAPPLSTSGSNPIGPFLYPQRVDLLVTCLNSAGVSASGGATVEIFAIAPLCQPDSWEDYDQHVKIKVLPVSMWSQYQALATWFCRGADGEPKQQTFAYDIDEAVDKAKRRLQGLITKQQIVDDCNRNCRAIPDGPLKDYMATWKAQFTAEQIGVIE